MLLKSITSYVPKYRQRLNSAVLYISTLQGRWSARSRRLYSSVVIIPVDAEVHSEVLLFQLIGNLLVFGVIDIFLRHVITETLLRVRKTYVLSIFTSLVVS